MSEQIDIKQLRIDDLVDYSRKERRVAAARVVKIDGEKDIIKISSEAFGVYGKWVLISDLRRHVPEKKEKPLEVGDKIDCTFEGRTYTGWTIRSFVAVPFCFFGDPRFTVNIEFGRIGAESSYARVPLESIKPHVPEKLKLGDIVKAEYVTTGEGRVWTCSRGKIVGITGMGDRDIALVSGVWTCLGSGRGEKPWTDLRHFRVLTTEITKLSEAAPPPEASKSQYKYGELIVNWDPEHSTFEENREPNQESAFKIGDLVTASEATCHPGIKCVLGSVRKKDSSFGNKDKALLVEGAWVRSPATPTFKATYWVDIDKAIKFDSYVEGQSLPLNPTQIKPEVKYVPKVGDKVRASRAMYNSGYHCVSGRVVKVETPYSNSGVPCANIVADVKGTWVSSVISSVLYDHTERVYPSDLVPND